MVTKYLVIIFEWIVFDKDSLWKLVLRKITNCVDRLGNFLRNVDYWFWIVGPFQNEHYKLTVHIFCNFVLSLFFSLFFIFSFSLYSPNKSIIVDRVEGLRFGWFSISKAGNWGKCWSFIFVGYCNTALDFQNLYNSICQMNGRLGDKDMLNLNFMVNSNSNSDELTN